MKIYKSKIVILVVFFIAITSNSCNVIKVIKDSANTLNNFSKLKFKLGEVSNFRISTIDISNVSSAGSISTGDVLKLTQAVVSKKLPVEFTLGVMAQNPNSTSGNTNSEAIINKLDWKLYIDNIETIKGVVSSPIKVPAGSSSTLIPVSVQLDLYDFFGNKGYDHLINLALAIGGAKGSSSRLKIEAKPTVSIAGFPISYPNYITIVNSGFNDK